ncbi:hypothetical protein KHA96_03420 [Bacillus sp. FJAT-49711]|uniref:hypothetical protein n=1 Tax=Bacillus sp. FJAT-49711 TaxID=2833585 RepID=UPI001BC9AC37|nr:hypothetical protein [Bacillus sp. FJAT-49711]MBS4217360.1 hypothetical protein [Bacillus sp. FJAT-49711]
MKIQRITVKGERDCNEDRIIEFSEKGIFGVIDGVSGVNSYVDKKGLTSGAVAAETILEYLAGSDNNADLYNATLGANDALRDKMLKLGIDINQVEELWGAAHALIRIGEHFIEWVQSGDCMLYAIYTNGAIRAVTYDSVAEHDQKVIDVWKKMNFVRIDGNLPYDVRSMIRNNRRLANKDGGYSVINGDPALANHLESGILSRSGVACLLLITDGIYGFGDYENEMSFVRALLDDTLVSYTEKLCEFERLDSECRKVPRLKQSDDKSGLLIQLQ